MRILTLEHFCADGPGKILIWAEARQHQIQRVLLDRGGALPSLGSFDVLIIMGGPMNIYQHRDHPWLVAEKDFIRAAIEAGKPVLGICLGAQLIADVLGGKVVQNPEREVGWWPVRFLARPEPFAHFPEELIVCHWHGDTFSLPHGAIHIAESAGCTHQAFLYGDRVVGLQFHIELGQLHVEDLATELEGDLAPGRYVQTREQLAMPPPDEAAVESALYQLLDHLAAKAC